MLGGSTNRKEMARLLAFSQIGMEMVAPIVVGLFLDRYFGWSPWGVLVGVFLGLIGGLAHLVQLASQSEKDMESPPNDPPEVK